MIDRDFWMKIAARWIAPGDGIEIPEIGPVPDELGLDFDDAMDEIEDILADLDI